ncbi:uncharacterized protein LOC144132496 [Amblyomma americanum]
MPGCCVPLCSNHSRNGWRMFSFPRDPKRRLLWTVKIKRDKWQPANSSRICNAHFEDNCYENHRADGRKLLKSNAVPTIFSFRPMVHHQRKAPKERGTPALPTTSNSTVQEQGPGVFADCDEPGGTNLSEEVVYQPSDGQTEQNEGCDAHSSSSCCAQLRKQLEDVRKNHRQLQEVHKKANLTINSLKKKVRKLKSAVEHFKKRIKFLNKDQVRALSRKSNKGSIWSPQTIKQGLQLKFSCGKSGYRTLRQLGYPLPAERTLSRRLHWLKFSPGILTDVVELLQAKAQGMEDVEKDCVLFIDEMEIARGFQLDRAEDIVYGGVTLPQKPDEPANHALVFMVGGLNQRWKQVIAYHFTGSHVDGRTLKDIVLQVVQLCADISLRVRVVTSDMGASNRAMWRELGFSSHRNSKTTCSIPHPSLNDMELFFNADAAHVLKNIKGQLITSHAFTLSEATASQCDLPSREVKLDHVHAVLEFDKERELKLAPKLSEAHVSSGHFTKMKVGLAVQFFREAPSAIRYLIKEKVLDIEAETTAWFLELVSRWYALMSSRHPSVALSLHDVAKHHRALETLNLALNTFQGMSMGSTSQWKPSQAGLLISTTVVLRLQDILLNSEGYSFLLTSRLLQDCLENLFSVVRLRKPVPDAYDMKCALKLVCISQFLHTPSTTSYSVDDSEYLVDLLSNGKRELAEAEVKEIDDSEVLFIEALTSTECSILFHIAGFLVKGILKAINNCEQCKATLLGSSDAENAYLTRLKEYLENGDNLHYPSPEVMKVLKSCEEHFKGITEWAESLLTMKSPVQAVITYLRQMVPFNVETCQAHNEIIQKLLYSTYARTRLRIHLRQLEEKKVNGHASKTCAGVSLP